MPWISKHSLCRIIGCCHFILSATTDGTADLVAANKVTRVRKKVPGISLGEFASIGMPLRLACSSQHASLASWLVDGQSVSPSD